MHIKKEKEKKKQNTNHGVAGSQHGMQTGTNEANCIRTVWINALKEVEEWKDDLSN